MGTWNGLGCWEPGALITIRDDGKLNMLAVINGHAAVCWKVLAIWSRKWYLGWSWDVAIRYFQVDDVDDVDDV